MKQFLLLMATFMAAVLGACGQSQPGSKTSENTAAENNKKTAVVYFSATGTTRGAAEKIASTTGGDLIAIEPVQAYTSADLDWNNKDSRSSVEMGDASARPAVKKTDADLSGYDVIFLGYPIWWDLAPRVVNSFIEANKLDGKTVVPFATSGGSSISNSIAELKKSYPDVNWTDGRLLNRASDKSVKDWISSLSIPNGK